ncbi:hypothetical protein RvY_09192 [Ramazzottius varieornatus]|uniref:protein-tyrosine-phosphatase n=1 Tax=Ramazzottius varieornatus TaxID=947166 RepID=A0A1D1VD32_RAMVA|nr:hypothetical protein RvY_09192 [Ramazzottius varieornatus]
MKFNMSLLNVWTFLVPLITLPQNSRSAVLTVNFPNSVLPPPSSADIYTFLFAHPDGSPPTELKYVSENYSTPLIVSNVVPSSIYNVTVLVNDFPLPTKQFLSSPDPPVNLKADVSSPNETVVYWDKPEGKVDNYRMKLLSRDAQGKISPGVPMDWKEQQIRITPLLPGGEYAMEIVSVFQGLASTATRIPFMQFPAPPKNFRKLAMLTNETSLVLQWDPAEGFVDTYYLLIDAPVQPNESLAPPFTLRHVFQKLKPGQTYQVAITSVRGNFSSVPSVINATTRPLPPAEAQQVFSSNDPRTIEISWLPPASGHADGYRVSLNASDGSSFNTTRNDATWTGLVPGVQYTVNIESYVVGPEGLVLGRALKKTVSTRKVPDDPTVSLVAVPTAAELTLEALDNSVRFLEANATSEDNLVTKGDVSDGRHVYFRDLVGGTHYLIYAKLLRNDVPMVVPFENMTYPLRPVNVSASTSSITSIVVQWSRPLNTRLQGYEIVYSKHDDVAVNNVTLPDSGVNYYNLTGLTPGTKYSIQMRSLIENVRSADSETVSQCTRPLEPLSVTIKPLSVKLLLQLTRPSNSTKYYRVRLVNLDLKDLPPRSMDIRNDSSIVQVPIPIDYLGAVYEVRVSTFMCDLTSDPVTVVVSSLPPVVNFNRPPAEVTQKSIKLVIQPSWPPARSILDRYAFQISGSLPRYYLPSELKSQTVEFDNLVQGTRYVISAWTERGEVSSDKKSIEVQLKPDNVTNLNISKITSHGVSIEWTPPDGAISQYEVGISDAEPIYTNETVHTFTNLLPFKNYSVYVAAWSGTERSFALTKSFMTSEDKPGSVSFFNLGAIRPTRLQARWGPPEFPNGILTNYLLDYRESDGSAPWTQLSFPATNLSSVLALTPGKTYALRVAAVNKAGIGPAQDGSMTMPLGPPVLARSAVRPGLVAATKNTITLEFSRNDFLNSNGDVVNYTVIVAEEPIGNLSANLLSWRDVQGFPTWPPYQALESFNPFTESGHLVAAVSRSLSDADKIQVVVGSDQNCDSSKEKYCNGPLKENSKYYAKLRAFTSLANENPMYTDTIYTDAISTEGFSRNGALSIALGICIPIILIILLVIFIAMMRKRNWGPFVKRARKAPHKTVEDKISIAESITDKSRPVRLRDFAEHVRAMSADSDFKFSEEYEDLKHVGRDQPCVAADLPVNRAKNRFTNIAPYDHSRVKLSSTDDEEGSDYINANYMPGQNSPREFIATQGPLPGTRDDFWRMVWEQGSRAIVMLTRCVEKGREKCDHYWPDILYGSTDPVLYGDVSVTVLNESQFSDWTTRELRVVKDDEPARSVRQFHFTAWPDFGVPERLQTFIKFIRFFRERVPLNSQPIVVHCSAGVGRSGTFIALDRLLQQIETQDTVDIFGMVHDMRKERVWMVQTEQQYICIHQCLLCVLEKREEDPDAFDTGVHANPAYEISDEDEGIVESGPF